MWYGDIELKNYHIADYNTNESISNVWKFRYAAKQAINTIRIIILNPETESASYSEVLYIIKKQEKQLKITSNKLLNKITPPPNKIIMMYACSRWLDVRRIY